MPPYAPLLSSASSTTPGSSSGYFPPPSVWGAQSRSQVDLATSESTQVTTPASELSSPQYSFNSLPFGSQVVGEKESFEEIAPLPEPNVAFSDPWPATPPLRLASRRLNRKLPPLMTESLEKLANSHHQHDYIDTLASVPEDAPSRPRRSPLREQFPPIKSGTLQQLQQLQGQDRLLGLRGSVPRSASLPIVPTQNSISLPSRPAVDRSFSCSSEQHGSCASSDSDHSREWIVTPASTPVSSSGRLTSSFDHARAPVEFIASQADIRRARSRKAVEDFKKFDADRAPDVSNLLYALELDVVSENGKRVRFGDIVGGTRKTIVIFVRHWLSSFCAQYIKALIAKLTDDVLSSARAKVVVIGHGSQEMIAGFRAHFHCPFPVYTDESRRLQDTLGVLPQSIGPKPPKGDYVVQNAIIRACETLQLAARLHGFRSGDRAQLGGEFVFDGSLRVAYAHRMTGVTDHAPVQELFGALTAVAIPLSASRSCVTLPQAKGLSRPTSMEVPIPPVRPTEEECVQWEEQRASLMLVRRNKTRTTFSDSTSTRHSVDLEAVSK